jgi:ribosomal RNA assembly protein
MKYVRIPVDRVGVLIGRNGEIKKFLEERSGLSLDVDSKQGEIAIDEHNVTDPLVVMKMENIIRAIGRGFSPEHAMRLFSDEAEFFVFDIYDYVAKKESHVKRVKSRIIGREGKTRRILEELTSSNISVYGHTISVIADIVAMDVVKRAVDMLLCGSKHASVYRFIENQMKEIRRAEKFGF